MYEEKIFLKLTQPGSSQKLMMHPDEIPTLSPAAALADFQKGDSSPFYKLQRIDYPLVANDMHYGKEFFESYVSHLSERPIPGSKGGHNLMWGVRSATDFLLVGGRVDDHGDGTGSVYLKNYIPPKAESDNANFITECKADLVHFSVVAYVNKKIETIEGQTKTTILDCASSGLRNDAVSYGEGAMPQITNAESAKIESNSAVGGDQYVCWEDGMDKTEFLESLKNHTQSGITLPEIAQAMGQGHQLVTKEHEDALKVVNAIKEAGINDPVKEVATLKKTIEDNQKTVRNAALDTAFGADTEGKNYLRQYAEEKIALNCADIQASIEAVKKSPVAIRLAADKADYLSDTNIIGKVEPNKKITIPGEVPVIKL